MEPTLNRLKMHCTCGHSSQEEYISRNYIYVYYMCALSSLGCLYKRIPILFRLIVSF